MTAGFALNGLVASAFASAALLGFAPSAAAQEDWSNRIGSTLADESAGWQAWFALGQELADATGPEALDALKDAWPGIDNSDFKQQVVKAWHFDLPAPFRVRYHPLAFEFFDMVLAQDEEEVSDWVQGYLPSYAWQIFGSDESAREWIAAQGDTASLDAAKTEMTRWIGELRDAENPSMPAELLSEIGYPLRRNEALIEAAREQNLTDLLLAAIEHDDVPYDAVERAAAMLTHLDPDRFPPDELSAFLEPFEERRERQAKAERARMIEALDVRTVDDDERRRWVLHSPRAADAPEGGYGLLVVMPGGDGSIDFAPFVSTMIRDAAVEGYVVVQMVAPPLNPEQGNAVVWPREQLPDDRVDFTMEQVVASAVDAVKREFEINNDHVWAMGWSSGGPPAYEVALMPDSPFAGAFIIMSVFKPDQHSPLEGAAGKSFHILHSPQDFIAMQFPQAAAEQLKAAGARTVLVEYEGGHGWHGDVRAQIEAAIRWLEEQWK